MPIEYTPPVYEGFTPVEYEPYVAPVTPVADVATKPATGKKEN